MTETNHRATNQGQQLPPWLWV